MVNGSFGYALNGLGNLLLGEIWLVDTVGCDDSVLNDASEYPELPCDVGLQMHTDEEVGSTERVSVQFLICAFSGDGVLLVPRVQRFRTDE